MMTLKVKLGRRVQVLDGVKLKDIAHGMSIYLEEAERKMKQTRQARCGRTDIHGGHRTTQPPGFCAGLEDVPIEEIRPPRAGHLRRWMEDATQDGQQHDHEASDGPQEECSLCADARAWEEFEELVKAAREFSCGLNSGAHRRLCAVLKAVGEER